MVSVVTTAILAVKSAPVCSGHPFARGWKITSGPSPVWRESELQRVFNFVAFTPYQSGLGVMRKVAIKKTQGLLKEPNSIRLVKNKVGLFREGQQ